MSGGGESGWGEVSSMAANMLSFIHWYCVSFLFKISDIFDKVKIKYFGTQIFTVIE